jgi:hypothetical protein
MKFYLITFRLLCRPQYVVVFSGTASKTTTSWGWAGEIINTVTFLINTGSEARELWIEGRGLCALGERQTPKEEPSGSPVEASIPDRMDRTRMNRLCGKGG